MTKKILTVVLMLALTIVAAGVSFVFAGIISLGARQFAGYLFIACCIAIVTGDVLWMLRVFRSKPLPQAR